MIKGLHLQPEQIAARVYIEGANVTAERFVHPGIHQPDGTGFIK